MNLNDLKRKKMELVQILAAGLRLKQRTAFLIVQNSTEQMS